MTGSRSTRSRTLAGIAGVSAIGTALSRITGLGRTVVQATTLGANGVSDAYNLANTTPNIIYDLVLGGVLAGTLIPVFVRALREDEESGWEAISAVCTVIAVVLGAITVVFFACSSLIIHFYTLTSHSSAAGEERRLAVSLLLLFVPQLALYGLTAVVSAILAARDHYAAPNYTPILNNVIVIGVLVVFGTIVAHPTPKSVRSDGSAVWLLGLGTTAGVAVMAVTLIPVLRRTGARLRWVWNPRHPAVRTILRLSGWLAAVVVANQAAYLVVILIANHKVGDFTAYSYAYQFFLLPHGIWAVSLLVPMETRLSGFMHDGDPAAARRQVTETMWSAMVLIVPAALGYAVLARPAINLVLLHGNMSPQGARAIADALIAFSLGLPTFSLFAILMRTYQAMQDTRSMFVLYAFENALNIALALLLYPRFGIRGLAASWGLAYAGAALVALWNVGHRLGGLGGSRLGLALGAIVGASLPTAGAAWVVSTAFAHLPGGTHQLGVGLRLVGAVGVAVVVYYVCATALGFEEIRSRHVLRRRVTFPVAHRSDRVRTTHRPRRPM